MKCTALIKSSGCAYKYADAFNLRTYMLTNYKINKYYHLHSLYGLIYVCEVFVVSYLTYRKNLHLYEELERYKSLEHFPCDLHVKKTKPKTKKHLPTALIHSY